MAYQMIGVVGGRISVTTDNNLQKSVAVGADAPLRHLRAQPLVQAFRYIQRGPH